MVKTDLKSCWFALVTGCFAVPGLIGCQGQNPLKMINNPMDQYATLNEAGGKKYIPGNSGIGGSNPFDLTRPNCNEPYAITVSPDHGNLTAVFNYDSASTYVINVHGPEDAYSIEAEKPFGSEVNLVKGDASNGGDIKLTWKPVKANLTGLPNPEVQQLILHIKSTHVQNICDSDAEVAVNLVIPSSLNQPIVSFSDIPQTPVKSGKVDFQVNVDDPAAAKGLLSPEVALQNATEAITCEREGHWIHDGFWQFQCELDPSKVSSSERPGTTIDYPFSVTAKSRAGAKLSSAVTPAGPLRITLPKNDPNSGEGK